MCVIATMDEQPPEVNTALQEFVHPKTGVNLVVLLFSQLKQHSKDRSVSKQMFAWDISKPDNGKTMKPVSLLQLCRIGVIIYDWLDIPWLKAYYNFGSVCHRRLDPSRSHDSRIDGNEQPSSDIPRHILFQLRYQAHQEDPPRDGPVPSGILGIHPLLSIRVLQMSQWRHPSDVPPPYKGNRDENWQDNDGALNTISMTHPRLPNEHPSRLVVDDSDCLLLQPGTWYYKIIEEADHILFIVNRERAGVRFDLIYDSIFERCRKHVFRQSPPTLPNQPLPS
ncbi:tryptophan aminotransferase 1 [Hibiscus syriacus]|uniref:Tryptophan aminotransferase 1 n=1 Tax=Hibiscus syriacus TaxID=106335 RepID=A0A6A3A3R1_HIBSY|nr:tryptophan aminotransferase 1 [Hibiscus syriacus]